MTWFLTVHLQKNIKYKLIGLSSGPEYFKVNQNTGQVQIKKDLRTDPVKLKKYSVRNASYYISVSAVKFTSQKCKMCRVGTDLKAVLHSNEFYSFKWL